MIGAIIGDTVGSIYEFENYKAKDFELFPDGVSPTDDSILSFATADWIMRGGEAWKYYVAYASKYECPVGGYGGGFTQYVARARRDGFGTPYNSCGNGSAMRVSPAGFAARGVEEAKRLSAAVTRVSHNHPEGMKGAEA